MQDEITKHTRKAYKAWKHPQHSPWEKVKEIIIEICIIVFAVTLSIWLHSWSEHRHEQDEARAFLKDLKDDLQSDIKELAEQKAQLTKSIEAFTYLYNLNAAAIDSAEKSGTRI